MPNTTTKTSRVCFLTNKGILKKMQNNTRVHVLTCMFLWPCLGCTISNLERNGPRLISLGIEKTRNPRKNLPYFSPIDPALWATKHNSEQSDLGRDFEEPTTMLSRKGFRGKRPALLRATGGRGSPSWPWVESQIQCQELTGNAVS